MEKIMDLLTTSQIAKQLNTEREKVSYAIRRMKIAPTCVAGRTRVFDEKTVEYVDKFLKRNDFINEISSNKEERLNV